MEYANDLKLANDQKKLNKAYLKRIGQQRPRDLDDRFHSMHEQAFLEIDCLKCANCCKTTSPLFQQADIQRLAKALRMKVAEFVQTYLRVDEDGDHVLKQAPCPFLDVENYCTVYEDRPKACREYPHTNRKRMYQIMDLTFKNTLVCPAVSRIVRTLRENEK